MEKEITLETKLVELLNIARRSHNVALVEVPPNYITNSPPALIIAVIGDDISRLKEIVMRRFELDNGKSDSRIIIGGE